MPDFVRKRNRLRSYDYASNNMYFITICTLDKACILCDPQDFLLTETGQTVMEAVESIPRLYEGISLMHYVIMPNHVHMLLLLNRSNTSVSTVVNQMKRHISLQTGRPVWQKSFFDHIVRNEADYLRIWEYIGENPKKWSIDRYNPDYETKTPPETVSQ